MQFQNNLDIMPWTAYMTTSRTALETQSGWMEGSRIQAGYKQNEEHHD
jgi:uncharacterized protein affecting Mg2+/Co2+ transport